MIKVEPVDGRTFWSEDCARIEFADLQVGDRFVWMDNLRKHPLEMEHPFEVGSTVPIMKVEAVEAGCVMATRVDCDLAKAGPAPTDPDELVRWRAARMLEGDR